MKQLLLVVALGVLALPVQAQDVDQVRVAGQKLTTPLPHYKMWKDDFKPFKGEYTLSNGLILTVSSSGQKKFAQVGNLAKHEIVPVGPDRFEALDAKLSLHIDLRDNGSVGGELSYYDDVPATADTAAPGWITVAMR